MPEEPSHFQADMQPGEERPNPDDLLRQVQRSERAARRGRLTIFFGASAGVGKTFAMLAEARNRLIDGVNVVVGYAEPHNRPETEALLLGLDILPCKWVQYRGTTLQEFDLDLALQKAPELILVDELAHTNAPGMRHAKRWQDVEELLTAGINVYTTLNVQYLSSVNDLVERSTGVKVRETLPDDIFEKADAVQLVDLPPEKLIERLRDGKIYLGPRGEEAINNFFKMGNLLALRELALQKTAERINCDIDAIGRSGGADPAAVSQRLMVCVGPSPSSANLVRIAARMAGALKSPWIALYVETPTHAAFPAADRQRVWQTLDLAAQLGAQCVTLTGSRPEREIIAYARKRRVVRIIIGKPAAQRWRRLIHRSFLDSLILDSGDIQLILIRQDADPKSVSRRSRQRWLTRSDAAVACLTAGLNTAIGIGLYHGLGVSDVNVIMVYLLGVLWVSARYSRRAGILTTFLSVLCFDFTVVRPYYSFAVSDTQYLLTFAVMLLTGVFISELTTRLRTQEQISRLREQNTSTLLQFSRELIVCPDIQAVTAAAVRHVTESLDCPVAIMRPGKESLPQIIAATPGFVLDEKESGVADWVIRSGKPAGAGSDTLPLARGLYLPLTGVNTTLGALSVMPAHASDLIAGGDQMRTLESIAAQTAVAMERMLLADENRKARTRTELELVRNTLLSAVSHDLRTPLAVITGSATSIMEAGGGMPAEIQTELITTIAAESRRMEQLIDKLLAMTRLESGQVNISREKIDIGEIVIAAAERYRSMQPDREIRVSTGESAQMIQGDPVLLEQLFSNLLENAIQHSGVSTPIDVAVIRAGDMVEVRVMDSGVGLSPEELQHVFDKFFRGRSAGARGLGLGLAICRIIALLHNGAIHARQRSGGGAEFVLRLPLDTAPSQVPLEQSVDDRDTKV